MVDRVEGKQTGSNSVQVVHNSGVVHIHQNQQDEKDNRLESYKTESSQDDLLKPFIDAVTSPLFYEDIMLRSIGGEAATLLDVYTEPLYNFIHCHHFNIKKSFKQETIFDFIYSFICVTLEETHLLRKTFSDDLDTDYTPRLLIIEGEGGMGKSSLTSILAYRYKVERNEMLTDKNIMFCKLKNISSLSNKAAEDFMENVTSDLGKSYGTYDFSNVIFILDGFDELCLLEDFRTKTQIQRIIASINSYLLKTNSMCILTTRPNIISDYSGINSIILKLELFSDSNVKAWVNSYVKKHTHINANIIERYINCVENAKEDNKIVFGIPITNYMSFCLSVLDESFDISRYTNIFQIYDKIFGDNSILFTRKYDSDGDHPSSKFKFELRELTKSIALEMFNNHRLILSVREIRHLLDNNEAAKSLGAKEKEWLYSYFGIAFFMNISHGLVEFVHLTIQEYFAIEGFLSQLTGAYKKIWTTEKVRTLNQEDYIDFYNDSYSIFANNAISGRKLEFLVYKLNQLEEDSIIYDAEKKLNLIEKSFVNFLVNDPAVFTNKYRTSAIKQSKIMFANLWNVAISIHGQLKPKTEDKTSYYNIFSDVSIEKINSSTEFKTLFAWTLSDISSSVCQDMSGLDLSEIHLTSYTFSHSLLSNVNLTETRLNKLKFENSQITDSLFANSYIYQADFFDVDFTNSNLRNVFISSVTFKAVCFKECRLEGANFTGCTFIDCDFSEAILDNAHFKSCSFENVDFRRARLSGCIILPTKIKNTKVCIEFVSVFPPSNISVSGGNISVYENKKIDNPASSGDIIEALRSELIIRIKSDSNEEADSPVHDGLRTADDLRTVDLYYQIDRLSNKELMANFFSVINKLHDNVSSDEIMSSAYKFNNEELDEILRLYRKFMSKSLQSAKDEVLVDFNEVLEGLRDDALMYDGKLFSPQNLLMIESCFEEQLTKAYASIKQDLSYSLCREMLNLSGISYNLELSDGIGFTASDRLVISNYFKYFAKNFFESGRESAIEDTLFLTSLMVRSFNNGFLNDFSRNGEGLDSFYYESGLRYFYDELEEHINLNSELLRGGILGFVKALKKLNVIKKKLKSQRIEDFDE